MFKKLFLIFMAVIVLVGCKDKKVTADMIIGHWECEAIEGSIKFYDYNGALEQTDYLKDVNVSKKSNLFFKEEDFKTTASKKYNLDYAEFKDRCPDAQSYQCQMITNRIYISKDEFKQTDDMKIAKYDSGTLVLEQYTENLCKRIK